jgi:predicted transcriptional regulator of viral defense system/very-short-patch-repair endonuclease
MKIDAEIARLGSEQHALVQLAQLRALGVTDRELQYRLERGRLEHRSRLVYRIGGAPSTWRGELLAACWAGGLRAAASHRSAAELWGLAGRRTDLVEITCPRWRRARHDGVIVHETKAFDADDVSTLDGIPVTTASRTILDLGAVCRPILVEKALENALRRDLVSLSSMRAQIDRVARRGRNGVGVIRRIMDERNPDQAPTESDKETELLAVIRKHGLPTPVPQFEIVHNRRFVARVDFAYVEARLAIEYESYEHHDGKLALERDSARRNRMLVIGWLPLCATQADLRAGGHRLCDEIRQGLERPDQVFWRR